MDQIPSPLAMSTDRPTKSVVAGQVVGFIIVLAAIVADAPSSNWDPALFVILMGFSIFSDLTATSTGDKIRISGSFLALVLSMVFLGGAPAALIGVITISLGWLRWREETHYFIANLLNYSLFPLVGGVVFHAIVANNNISDKEVGFYVLVFGIFLLALAINFAGIAIYTRYLKGTPLIKQVRTALIPLLPSELMAALMAVGVAFLYAQVGIAGVALFGIVLITFQYLLGALLVSRQRAKELETRSNQLASFQVGMLSALLRTLDLRDQMTARHSAAVARYSRAIAQRAGFSRQEEELVHIAALLHDIGKFILPDRILKANVPLTDEDWMLIKRHPQQGARVVSSLDGYGPVADIILAHHERDRRQGLPAWAEGRRNP